MSVRTIATTSIKRNKNNGNEKPNYENLWRNLTKKVTDELEVKVDKQYNSFDDKFLDCEVEFLRSMLNTINEVEGCVKE